MTITMHEKTKLIKNTLQKPIVLVGLMAAGKTKIGHMLARKIALPFRDSDDLIVERAGCSIPDIFERDGEDAFRRAEKNAIRDLLSGDLRVISTGGGAVMSPKTAELVWQKSLSIWLQADLETHVRRVAEDRNRPLLKDVDPKAKFQALMDERYPVYAKADITVDTSLDSPRKTLGLVIDALYEYLK